MARSNMSRRADVLMGRSEKAEPNRISRAVSGWLAMTTGVAPRLNAISRLAFSEVDMAANFWWASGPICETVPTMGQPIGPESFLMLFLFLP